jgi:hypothetical protein
MISDVYILSVSIWKGFGEQQEFHDFVTDNFSIGIKDQLPPGVDLKSIDYEQDEIITSLLYQWFLELAKDYRKRIVNEANIEMGYCRFPEIIREKNSILPNYIIRLK